MLLKNNIDFLFTIALFIFFLNIIFFNNTNKIFNVNCKLLNNFVFKIKALIFKFYF